MEVRNLFEVGVVSGGYLLKHEGVLEIFTKLEDLKKAIDELLELPF